jgi:hypothetical protein
MDRAVEINEEGTVNKIMTERPKAVTPPSLFGIERRIA